MRIVLITDTHWGVRRDQQAWLDNTKKFLDDVFFPTLEKEKIKVIIHLGDLVDKRETINFNTANHLRTNFIEPLINKGMDLHWILGNHDIYWRNKTDITVAEELKFESDFITVYKEPTEVEFGGKKYLFLPWICESNSKQTEKAIADTDCKITFGHLELMGYEMFRGVVSPHGESPAAYSKFDAVYTGHFHQKNSKDNIHYLGAHGEFIWSDAGDDRGFHIFNTDDNSIQFISNPHTMFAKVFYDDVRKTKKLDFSSLKGKVTKVIVRSRTDSDQYNTFMAKVEAAQPLELTVVEDHLNMNLITDENLVSDTKDTLTIIRDYVKQANNLVDHSALDSLIVDLYQEAQGMEK